MKLKRLIVKHFGVFQGSHAFDLDDDLVLLYGPNFPTLHLDETRREQMREYVLGLLPRKQVILFTNDRVFADSFSLGKRIDLVHI